eukprot:NODE_52_length_30984_cov_1.383358.p1 type:complete len:765 gc:universal NODE_52_length_30984_cov_1.383358:25347-23053(-)
MLDFSQISGLEIEDCLKNKGFSLNLSSRPTLDERIANWSKISRLLAGVQIYISPKQVAAILKQDEIEYRNLLDSISNVEVTFEISDGLNQKNFNFKQHVFSNDVKKILKFGTKLKLPEIISRENLDVKTIQKEIDTMTNLDKIIDKYASQSSLLESNEGTPILERTDSKTQGIEAKTLVPQNQINSLQDLIVRDFKMLLDQQIDNFIKSSFIDEDKIHILEEKTTIEAFLAQQYKESENQKRIWSNYIMDKEIDFSKRQNLIAEKLSMDFFHNSLPKANSSDALKSIFYKNLGSSLKCMIFECIEMSLLQIDNLMKSNVIFQSETRRRFKSITGNNVNSLMDKFGLFKRHPNFQLLKNHEKAISLFNSIPYVVESFNHLCQIFYFVEVSNAREFELSEIDWTAPFNIIDCNLNEKETLGVIASKIFQEFCLRCKALNTEVPLQFLIHIPKTDSPEETVKRNNVLIDSKYSICESRNHQPTPIFSVNLEKQLDAPIIDEFHDAYNVIIIQQSSSLAEFAKDLEAFYLGLKSYVESCKYNILSKFQRKYNLEANYELLKIEFNQHDISERLSSEFKSFYQNKFNLVFIGMWKQVDFYRNDNQDNVDSLLSHKWHSKIEIDLKNLYFKYCNCTFAFNLSLNSFFEELQKAFEGGMIGQLKFDHFEDILLQNELEASFFAYINSLRPKKVDKKKTPTPSEKLIQTLEANILPIINEYKMAMEGVKYYISLCKRELVESLSEIHSKQTKYVDDLCEYTRYRIEAESKLE